MDHFHDDQDLEQPAMEHEDGGDEKPSAPRKKERRAPEAAVDAVLEATRAHILDDDGSHIVRKPVPVTQQDRKKVRRRNVDTDVSVSDLVSAAVIDLLKSDTEVESSTRKRPAILTIAAPEWWWSLLRLRADASGAQVGDVVAVAIADHLP